MPRNVTIPARTYASCQPCEFFRLHLLKSGRDPIWRSSCTHPANYGMFGGDRTISRDGADQRPAWCPLRGDPQAEYEAMHNDDEQAIAPEYRGVDNE